jgi:hypothetical protein
MEALKKEFLEKIDQKRNNEIAPIKMESDF